MQTRAMCSTVCAVDRYLGHPEPNSSLHDLSLDEQQHVIAGCLIMSIGVKQAKFFCDAPGLFQAAWGPAEFMDAVKWCWQKVARAPEAP